MRWLWIPVVAGLLVVEPMAAEELVDGRRSIVLKGRQARLVIDILGGSIVDFHLLSESPISATSDQRPVSALTTSRRAGSRSSIASRARSRSR